MATSRCRRRPSRSRRSRCSSRASRCSRRATRRPRLRSTRCATSYPTRTPRARAGAGARLPAVGAQAGREDPLRVAQEREDQARQHRRATSWSTTSRRSVTRTASGTSCSSRSVTMPVQGLSSIAELAIGHDVLEGAQQRYSDLFCVRDTRGAVRCWGNGHQGQLGADGGDSSDVPVPIEPLPPAAQLALGSHHACALTTGGEGPVLGQQRVRPARDRRRPGRRASPGEGAAAEQGHAARRVEHGQLRARRPPRGLLLGREPARRGRRAEPHHADRVGLAPRGDRERQPRAVGRGVDDVRDQARRQGRRFARTPRCGAPAKATSVSSGARRPTRGGRAP
jgi:hypothetical protein